MLEVVSICLISEVVILVSLFAELIAILFCELRKVTVNFGDFILTEWSLASLAFILYGLLDQLMIILPLEWRCCEYVIGSLENPHSWYTRADCRRLKSSAHFL